MENSYKASNGNGPTNNGHIVVRHSLHQSLLHWLDLRITYVKFSKCELDDSPPAYLTINYIPLDPETLIVINSVRSSIYSDGVSTLLRRNRLDKKSEEATFVSTDNIRMTGSVKFEVFDKDLLVLSGVLKLCNNSNGFNHRNGFVNEVNGHGQRWSINCKSEMIAGSGFFKAKQSMSPEFSAPKIEVCIAGSFSGVPILLTKTFQLNFWKKHLRKGVLDSIPESDANEYTDDANSCPRLASQMSDNANYKPENEDYNNMYLAPAYLEGEDEELSWFNAGVKVGVGIGLSVCVGIGIGVGVGLLVRTYQGTVRNLARRLP